MTYDEVRAQVESVLSDLRPGCFPREAVNWGDLHCVDVRQVVEADGFTYWLVNIEEVSPDAYELRQAIETRLAERGITAEVLADW